LNTHLDDPIVEDIPTAAEGFYFEYRGTATPTFVAIPTCTDS